MGYTDTEPRGGRHVEQVVNTREGPPETNSHLALQMVPEQRGPRFSNQ